MSKNSMDTTTQNQQLVTKSSQSEVGPSRRAVQSSVGVLRTTGAVERVAGRSVATQQTQSESWPQYDPDSTDGDEA